jgi:phosphonate transport system substrate-binding protein
MLTLNKSHIYLILLVILANGFPVIATENTGDPLTIGIFPRRSADVTEKMFAPLVQHIAQQLNRKVRLETAPDFATFWQKVARKRYDLVHYNQYHYLRSSADFGYQVILKNEEFGHDRIAAAIVVRKDSNIRELTDLKGKIIAFGGGKKAMISYIAATDLLREAGLNKGDYFEQFSLTPPKAVMAAYFRQSTAAGAGNYVLDLPKLRKEIDADEMMYLAISPAYAHLPWATSEKVSPTLRKQLQQILSSLKSSTTGRQILKQAGLTNLKLATDDEYDPLRKIVDKVLKEKY